MIEPVFKKPPPEGDPEPPPKRKRLWWRFTLASLVIVVVSAAATATSIILYLDSIAKALSHHNIYKHQELNRYLSQVEAGEPENLLIIGSDKRASMPEDPGRSDTTILLRLDPDSESISIMSIPRDLKVEIPGYGTNKFNAAYSFGGPKLTLRVVKELTGLPINHVVNVDFLGFVKAVDAIDCVYVDVDRRYYHSNLGVPPAEQYSEINIQPGYQVLCGKKALEYVRYRHTDTDLVRSARQQEFLSEARERVPISKLAFDQNGLIDIFTHYTTSDISDYETMLKVLELFIISRNAPVREIHFPAVLGPSYVYSSPGAIHGAVEKFLGIEPPVPSGGALEGGEKEKSGKGKSKKHKHHGPKPPEGDGLVPAQEAGEAQGEAVARKVGSDFPVFYPTRLPPGASFVEDDPYERVVNPRVYGLNDTDGNRHRAYSMVMSLELPDGLHYFGVQGIQGWEDPPLLDDPTLTKTIAGREYQIFVEGGRLKLIAWHEDGNTYWVANSLLQELTNVQMVGMARSMEIKRPKPTPRRNKVAQ